MRWPNGGRSATTGNGDAAPQTPDPAADAAQIQALLIELSRVRLAVSADLSAAAGALDGERPDIAADMLAGARRELGELAGLRNVSRPAQASAQQSATGGARAEVTGDATEGNAARASFRRRHRVARAMAGAAALAVAVAVVPQLAGNGSHTPRPAAAAPASPALSLASSQFSTLSQRLIAANSSPAAIAAAGRDWQSALSRDLPAVASKTSSASTLVTMLRLERTLLEVSPTLQAPANRGLATELSTASNALLQRLRQLASPQVLHALPAAIEALPLASPSKPKPAQAAAPVRTNPAPALGTGAAPVPLPSLPSAPTARTTTGAGGASNPQLPAVGNAVPLPPLPSTLGQITSGSQGNLNQTVTNVLSGLGLGG